MNNASFHTSSIRHSFAVKKLLQGYAEIIFKKTGLSRKTRGRFLNEPISDVLAGKVASTSMEDAVHCEDGCSALQRRLQCTAGAVAVHCV